MAKKGLGRGLDDLLGADESNQATPALPVEKLQAGKYQPRTRMDEASLNELAESIKDQGIMQPILVRPIPDSDGYEIIAGERRFRAAIIAGLNEVPVIIKEVEDEKAAIMALIENIQRENLNPLEEAHGIDRLIKDFGFTHELAAKAIGRSRSATTNLLRLLNLTEIVQEMLLEGKIDMGHARALLPVENALQIQLANQVVNKKLSVRETEKLVIKEQKERTENKTVMKQENPDVLRIQTTLSDALGTHVEIKLKGKDAGALMVHFHGWEHLNDLLEKQGLLDYLRES